MIRRLEIAVLGCLVLLLAGCEQREKSEPIWEQVKLGDLVPSGRSRKESLKTISFEVSIVEMPAENISGLDDIWEMLYEGAVRLNDYDAFGANLFSVGFGQLQVWNKMTELLVAAGGNRVKTVSMLLVDGQADDLGLVNLYHERTVFYVSAGGSMRGVAVGPGRVGLRIRAKRIPGSRGVCSVDVGPAFSAPVRRSVPPLAGGARSGGFYFRAAGFGLRMSPGDFVLLGPKEYVSSQMTLGSLFFSKPEGTWFFSKSEDEQVFRRPELKPAVRLFLIVCTRIDD